MVSGGVQRWAAVLAVVSLSIATPGCSSGGPPEDTSAGPVLEDGYDLIVLAGQSNMQGNGLPKNPDPPDPRVSQYAASGPQVNQIVPAVDPLLMPVPGAGIGPGTTFGRAYADSMPNRRVLLVPTAFGGEPLVTDVPPTWNSAVAGSRYDQMVSLTKGALAAGGPKSRVVAFLWIQGETDAAQQVSDVKYQSAFGALIDKMRSDLAAPDLPVVVGQMVPDMLPFPGRTRTQINSVQVAVGSRVFRASFAPGPFGERQDAAHYNSTGIRTLARNMFDAYQRLMNWKPDPALPPAPAEPTGVTVSDLSESTYTLSWQPVGGPAVTSSSTRPPPTATTSTPSRRREPA